MTGIIAPVFGRLILFAILISLLTSCSSSKLCCASHDESTDFVAYCEAHRDAVVKYVRAQTDNAERRVRLEQVRDIYDIIKFCRRMHCVERDMYADNPGLEEFVQRYTLQHELAEQNIRIRDRYKVDLLLCGLEQGIQEMDLYLEERGF